MRLQKEKNGKLIQFIQSRLLFMETNKIQNIFAEKMVFRNVKLLNDLHLLFSTKIIFQLRNFKKINISFKKYKHLFLLIKSK